MNIQGTLDYLRSISDEVQELRRKAKDARQAALQPFLDELAKTGLVSLIVVRGYTPVFNDGEPCEHSSDYYVNIEGARDILEDFDFGDWTDELKHNRVWNPVARTYDDVPEAPEHNRKLCAEHGHVFDTPSEEIMQAIKAVIYDTIEEDFGTNYQVVFLLNDGKFERSDEDYDCGY